MAEMGQPRVKPKLEWEEVENFIFGPYGPGGEKDWTAKTWRARVPGGWLVKVVQPYTVRERPVSITVTGTNSPTMALDEYVNHDPVALTFVPHIADPTFEETGAWPHY